MAGADRANLVGSPDDLLHRRDAPREMRCTCGERDVLGPVVGDLVHVCPPLSSQSGSARETGHLRILERAMGFEPTTLTLARLCSTPELHPRSMPQSAWHRAARRLYA